MYHYFSYNSIFLAHLDVFCQGSSVLDSNLKWTLLYEYIHTYIIICMFKCHLTSLVVWWSELLTTNHEVPATIPGSTMGFFRCRGRIPVVTMVWVVSRIRLKVETSRTRRHNSINSD